MRRIGNIIIIIIQIWSFMVLINRQILINLSIKNMYYKIMVII
jgi:hypothetical protein